MAGACAHNRLALVVPCHRVIRSDGALGGFRWGLQVKQALLKTESVVSTQLYDSPVSGAAAEHGAAEHDAADEIDGRTGTGTRTGNGDLNDGADIDVDERVAG